MNQVSALFQIRRRGAACVSEISDELGVTSPAASQLLDRLVQQGLVARSEDPSDRRLKQIALTPQGDRILKEGLHARLKWLEDLGSLLSPEEQARVSAAIQLLIEKAEQLDRQPSN